MLIAHLNYIFLILLSVCCFQYFTWFKFRYYVLVINIFIDTGTHEMHCDFVYLTIYLYAYIYKCIYIWQTDWLNEIINLWMCMPNACVSSDAPVCMGVCMYYNFKYPNISCYEYCCIEGRKYMVSVYLIYHLLYLVSKMIMTHDRLDDFFFMRKNWNLLSLHYISYRMSHSNCNITIGNCNGIKFSKIEKSIANVEHDGLRLLKLLRRDNTGQFTRHS